MRKNKILNYIYNFIILIVDLKNKKKILFFFKKKKLDSKINIFDIGAHQGETINFFINNFSFCKIFSFEPNYQLYKKLKKKFKKNNKVKIFNIAFGEKHYSRKLNIYADTASSSFNNINYSSSYYKRKRNLSFDNYKADQIETKIISIKSFLEEQHINQIDILKIDTEGYEYKILQGIGEKNFKKIKFIYFEHHYNNMLLKNYKFSDINKILTINNFKKVFKIKMSLRKSFEYIYKNKKYD